MNRNFGHVKSALKEAGKVMKRITTKYHKVAGAAVVVTTLCAVCTVSLANQFQSENQSEGVMISLAEVKESNQADIGFLFDSSSVTYADMQDMLYDTNQLARLETSEKQIEAILSSVYQDDKDQAAVYALTATEEEKVSMTASAAIPGKKKQPVVTASSSGNKKKPAKIKYADKNGNYEYQGDFILTAYCACPICCGAYSNMESPTTASGAIATANRTIAADTSVFPFGTELVINGQVYVVEDRGGAIQGNRLDVYFDSHEAALIFGRQTAEVYKVTK